MVFRADWTLPCRTWVISLMAHRSSEDHQISFMHHHAHLPLLCQGHFRQDLRLGGVMDPDQFAAPVKILGVGRTLQRHQLAWLNLYISGSLRTHACGQNVIWFYSHVWVTKTPQINILYSWTLMLLDWSCAISYNTSKLTKTYVFSWFSPDKMIPSTIIFLKKHLKQKKNESEERMGEGEHHILSYCV